jgi:hypothetical protein
MMPTPMQPTAKPLPLTSRTLLVVALVVGAIGCSDKAKPKYEECVALETKWKTLEARDACKAAAALDPNSKSGKLAAGKLTYLNEQADKLQAEKNKKEAPCKVGKWVTHCIYQGKPRPTLLEAKTFARCNTEADEVRIVGMTCPVCECADRFVDPYKKEGE